MKAKRKPTRFELCEITVIGCGGICDGLISIFVAFTDQHNEPAERVLLGVLGAFLIAFGVYMSREFFKDPDEFLTGL